jgi:hypothetical protein
MTNQHPITPPPELVREWNQDAIGTHFEPYGYSEFIATRAAAWGADTELDACCEYLYERLKLTTAACIAQELRAARRPKPLSLKEQALEALDMHFAAIGEGQCYQAAHEDTIRRALEALPE